MKLNKITLGFVAIFMAAIIAISATTEVSAQGRYVGQYSKAQVDDIIRRLEDSSDEFRVDFRRELDRSNLSSNQKNTYRRQVDTFENATDRLRSNFDSQNNWWNSRSQVQNVVANSRPLNVTMNAIGFRRNIERQWNQLRNNVNTLADTYDLPGIAGGGWNGGGGGGGGGQRPPNWARGTFYARNPQTGGTLQMTVENNGQVTFVQDGGTTTYGSMSGTMLINGPYRARVSQINNGIRTTSTTNSRDRIDYTRNNPGPGWGDGGGGGNVPSWAIGTFYARNPQTGGTIQMTIRSGGQVILVQDGSTTTYASLNGTILTNGPYQSRISRINNGIRTTSTTSNERIDYSTRRPW